MLKLFPFLKPYRLPIWIALSLMLVELMVELFHPLLLAKIIDEGVLRNDLNLVIRWGVIMIIMSLLAFASGVINSFYAAHVSQSTGFDLRSRLYEKIQTFSFEALQKFQTSSLITRLTNDVTLIQNTIFMSLRIMLRAPLLIIGGMIMALFVNVSLALILVVTIPIIVLFLTWMMKRGTTLFKLVQKWLDGVNHVIRENLLAMRIIKVFVTRKHEQNRFLERNDRLMKGTIKALRVMEIAMPLLLVVMNTAIILVLWFGSVAVSDNQAQVGEVVAIINYATRITGALTMFSMIVIIFSRTRASADRIADVLHTSETEQAEKNQRLRIENGNIVFKDVQFFYPNTNELVLNKLSFSVAAGETVAMIGETGSGKTSLFQLIPRFYYPSSGMILIDNEPIERYEADLLRAEIGYVPQEVLLFSGTIKENISWGKKDASMEEIIKAAQDAQIDETIRKLPNGYDTKIGQKGVNLSGGQKQRISIARALIRKPKILLLDDSTSALDVKTEERLLKALKEYKCTIIVITQKVSTAMEANKIILIEDGKVSDEGKHYDLLNSSALYQKLVDSQARKEVLTHE
ncbi:ABC transporter ATP-binding protein [Bacillus suaedae]|uniref:ABC transporter ATP-binding protein n=1 Tax=Halalkalibacter suaedae TaxID=2822140 RepID=A0A940X0X1_9BACI|nr:ABC transporter ATP-binding protein [Bacillus suaedae]MBP3952434.1 ABC transporter ATP-binding protein [Bacillus suaedae]